MVLWFLGDWLHDAGFGTEDEALALRKDKNPIGKVGISCNETEGPGKEQRNQDKEEGRLEE